MRPYETMLRRYRETARGLLGCYPAASTIIPATLYVSLSLSPSLSLSLSLSLSHLSGIEGCVNRYGGYRHDGVSVTKNNARWHDENCEKRQLSPMFFSFGPFHSPRSLCNRLTEVLRSRENYFALTKKIRVETYEIFLTELDVSSVGRV